MSGRPERLLLVGASHRTAPIALRERLALPDDELCAIARSAPGVGEAAVLGTCNRVELYVVAADADAARSWIVAELARRVDLPGRELGAALVVSTDDDAALHLCRVAAGLDSPILGEPPVLGQVRRAGEAAAAAGSAGPLLDRLFGAAVRAGKRVRNETVLGERPGSLAAAAARTAVDLLGDLVGRRVLVIGAGALGGPIAHRFRSCGCELVVASRTAERAAGLAAHVGGRVASLDGLVDELAGADIVVSCTRSPGLLLTAADVGAAGRRGAHGPLLLLDLAVPRDVDPAVGLLEGCRLHDVDDLAALAGAASARRRSDLDAAEAIAAEEAERFCAWRRSRAVAPAIAAFHRQAEAIRASELARAQGKLGALTAEQRRTVEAVTAGIVSKLLHGPTVRAKAAAQRQLGADTVSALCDLLALEEAR